MAKKLRTASEAMANVNAKYTKVKDLLDTSKEKAKSLKKDNTTLQRTIESLQKQMKTLQDSKDLVHANSNTKILIEQEKTAQLQLSLERGQEKSGAKVEELRTKTNLNLAAFAPKEEIKASSMARQQEEKKKKKFS